jgi:hypothetical protein
VKQVTVGEFDQRKQPRDSFQITVFRLYANLTGLGRRNCWTLLKANQDVTDEPTKYYRKTADLILSNDACFGNTDVSFGSSVGPMPLLGHFS